MLNPLRDQPQAIPAQENPLVASLPYILYAQAAAEHGSASEPKKQSDYHRRRRYKRQQKKVEQGQLPLPEIEEKYVGSAKRIKLSTDYAALTPSQGAYTAIPTGKIPGAKVNPQIDTLQRKQGFEVLQWTAEYVALFGHFQYLHDLPNSVMQGRSGYRGQE